MAYVNTVKRLTADNNRIKSLNVVSGTAPGRADFTASGDLPAPWTYTMHMHIRPSWDVLVPSSPFAVDLDPAASFTGPISNFLRSWLETSALNAYMNSLTNAVHDAAIRAHAAICIPQVNPALISGVPPPSVVISVRRVVVDNENHLVCWPVNAGFGDVTGTLFPPNTRLPSNPQGCLLTPANSIVSGAATATRWLERKIRS